MKIFGIVVKIVAALAAIAGIAFVVIKYGDKIVAWFKKTFGGLFCCCGDECCCDEDCCCDCCEDEDVTVEVTPVEEPAEGEVVAAEGDFEG